MNRSKILAPLALLGLLATAAHAGTIPQPADGARSRAVQLADLNLASARGAARLYDRLSSAAESVCGPSYKTRLSSKARRQSCVKDALDRAVAEVNSPLVTARHEARLGQRTARLAASGS